jgi:methionyl-tRNA formyltransferase
MRLTEGLDNGPVCLAESIPIGPHDTYGTLASRLQALGGELLLRALEESPPFVEQPEEGVTYAEKIGPEDRTLDPARPAAELERVVRALAPHIGARIALKDGITLGVRSASALPASASEPEGAGPPSATGPEGARPAGSAGSFTDPAPGQLAVRGGRLLYGTIDGALELLAVQPPGGRAMDAGAYLRGHGLLAQ